jgi:hypothetical protein
MPLVIYIKALIVLDSTRLFVILKNSWTLVKQLVVLVALQQHIMGVNIMERQGKIYVLYLKAVVKYHLKRK